MPTTKETKTKGTTSNFNNERKMLPRASMKSLKKIIGKDKLSEEKLLKKLPKSTPKAIPIKIFDVKDI